MFVKIYGRPGCPYCARAKKLSEKLKNTVSEFDYQYIDMMENNLSKEDVARLIGRSVQTVPQVIVDGQPIGGCTDFQALIKHQFNIEL